MTKTQSMTKINRGDVVLVEVIFSSGVGSKIRPVLILSDTNYNKHRDEIIVAGITSNTKRLHPGDTELEKWEAAGLKVPSLATAIIQTVKKARIQKRLGQIDHLDFEKVEKNIAKAIGMTVKPKMQE